MSELCSIHGQCPAVGELQGGGVMRLVQLAYAMTAAGSGAALNLRELGHITVRFDGEAEAEFPGSIHVSGPTPTDIPLGSTLSFIA
ncbi:PTS glucitol/sorbitol transporter subunit IIA [Serratia sp. SSNIH5]|uniref:PTS glucitol/sorbitol transporter subunit IIA n=1 Tax=Serratia sp. SSNIH5 TaxID=1920121 RepID=UPI002101ACD0|nr:PTS glucitol/sorbitol transporter subunit IIA [Serratia sp. SSNIH5]